MQAEFWSVKRAATVLLVVTFLTLALRALYNIYMHPLRRFPGPKLWAASYLLRHYYAVRGTLDLMLPELHEKYGNVVRISPSELTFTGEGAWRDVYGRKTVPLVKDPDHYNAIKNADQAFNINNAPPDVHVRIRKQLAPAFSDRALRGQEGLISSHVDRLMTRLRDFATNGEAFDLVTWYNFTSFDVISELALGRSLNCLVKDDYHGWVEALFEAIKIGPFLRAIAAYIDLTRVMKLLVPAKVQQARARHRENIQRLLKERLDEGVRSERPDFIFHILGGEAADQSHIDNGELVANCMFLMVAGSESTATTLSGLTYNLLMNPECLVRVIEEVRSAFAKTSDISFASSATRVPFLKACINETLRLYPPTPISFPRKTPQDRTVTVAGHEVPPSTTVGVHILSAHLDPSSFHDAHQFRPQRWTTRSTGDSKSPFFSDKHAACQPFGVGPQNCLGMSLAMKEMTLMMSRLLWEFDIELCDSSRSWGEEQKSFIIWEKGPLMCRVSYRKGTSGES